MSYMDRFGEVDELTRLIEITQGEIKANGEGMLTWAWRDPDTLQRMFEALLKARARLALDRKAGRE